MRYRGHSLAVEVGDGLLSVASAPSDLASIRVGCGDQVQELRPGSGLRFRLD